ncbi:MAG TPA: hypothetical protein P5555_20335 [Candidatus Paceibacterota bacterium]|nr:hypothetical protein [Verrucomicrobiota bacterium]HRZ47531.1 hypothetical protein [Candidatus Paceibacterota bacterium]
MREFVSWLEAAYGQAERAAASEFGVEAPPESLVMAEVALEAALGSQRPVFLATSASIKSLLAALVLRRAGVKLEQVFQGDLSDEQFTALADALRALRMSRLMVEMPNGLPGSET